MTYSSWRLFKHPSGTCYAAYILLLYMKSMPPPSHMERRRSIDVSHATPSFCTDEVIVLPCTVSSMSLCISHLCFGRCRPFQAVETLWKHTRAQWKIGSGHLTPFIHQSEKTLTWNWFNPLQDTMWHYPLSQRDSGVLVHVCVGPHWFYRGIVKYLLKPERWARSHFNSDGQMRICRSQLNSLISLSKLSTFLCRMTLAVLLK